MALKDTPKLIHHGLSTLSRLVDSDTDISTIDLNLLENLNTNQSLNYIKLEQSLNVLDKQATDKEVLQQQLEQYDSIIRDIECQVDTLEAVVDELDDWTKQITQ